MQKLTITEVLRRFKEVHGDYYDYSFVEATYKRTTIPVKIICPVHGEFWQRPSDHWHGAGCFLCSMEKLSKKFSLGTEEYVRRAKEVFSEYDYSMTEYINNNTPVKVKCCKEGHGIFEKMPSLILRGYGCPWCSAEASNSIYIKDTDDLKNEIRKIYGDLYNLDRVKYTGHLSRIKVTIGCPDHEWVDVRIDRLLSGHGCPKCKGFGYTVKDFIKDARKVHGNKYDYSLVVPFKSREEKVTIICPKHGPFVQKIGDHLRGRSCPKCNESVGERKVRVWLENHNIFYIYNKGLPFCKDKKLLPFDFFLPTYGVCIEYQGEQHYHDLSKNKKK